MAGGQAGGLGPHFASVSCLSAMGTWGKNTSLRADYASGAGLCGRCCCCLWWVVLVGGCACVWAVVRGWLWTVRQLCARVNAAVVVFGGGAAGGGGGGEDGGGGGGAGAGWGGKR